MGTMHYSVDPGKLSIALAVWCNSILTAVNFFKVQCIEDWSIVKFARTDGILFIERPQIYQMKRSKGDPNDLLDVMRTVGVCYAMATQVVEYKPAQWKGQVSKKVMKDRILKVLTESERAILDKQGSNEHIIDAIGIGLYGLQRS